MSNHQQYITLESCITDYLNESEQSNQKFFKLFHIAYRAMDELGIDFFYQIKSVKLPVASNKTVVIPEDYINYTKVGILNGKGEVVPLGYNSKLTTFADLMPERLSKIESGSMQNYYRLGEPIWYNYWDGNALGNLYGVPSGAPFTGSFKIDATNGVIVLEPGFSGSEIMLEYVSSPREDQDYYVPRVFREAIIAFLAWKDSSNIPPRSHMILNDKTGKRREYYNQKRIAAARFRPFYMDEAYQLSVQSQRLAIKS
jgi:hypothetical protein